MREILKINKNELIIRNNKEMNEEYFFIMKNRNFNDTRELMRF